MGANGKAKKSHPVLIIIISAVLLFGVYFLAMASMVSRKVRTNLSEEDKKSFAEFALMPRLADSIESYGVRGPMDPDYQIETCKYGSKEELFKAIPQVKSKMRSTEDETDYDLKSKKVKIYNLETLYPSDSKSSSFADCSLIDEDSMEKYYTWEYKVYEYNDGSYRFVIYIHTM